MGELTCMTRVVSIVVLLNLVLPKLAKPFATQEEIKPPNGAGNLTFKGQIMHMLVHHEQVPLTSSLIVAALVIVAFYLSQLLMNLKM